MSGVIAGQTGIFIPSAAKQAQLTILGLQWWIWLIILAIVFILIWLLFRQPQQEEKPVIEEPKIVPPFIEEPKQTDDLSIIEGIGPKINAVLHQAGIDTFKKLSEAPPEQIGNILNAAGIRLFDPTTWAEQADLAAAGRWDELKVLQDQLKGGRVV
jgi:hypothetical protein